ncbi:MAG: helix-turn-helix domain-containing protein [Myxococcota bacterium]
MSKPYVCPVKTATDVIGGKWKPAILFNLQDRPPSRLSELKRIMPWVSEKVLIRQLKELVEAGVVDRDDHGVMPPRVEYSLSSYGETLRPLLRELCAWGQHHLENTAP